LNAGHKDKFLPPDHVRLMFPSPSELCVGGDWPQVDCSERGMGPRVETQKSTVVEGVAKILMSKIFLDNNFIIL
jgi:hypothetical protein